MNDFINHDRNDKPDNDDLSRKDLYSLLFSTFIHRNEFVKEQDVYRALKFLPYQTLNEAYLAWYDKKDEIVQAQIEKQKLAINRDVKKNHVNLSQNNVNDENKTNLSDLPEGTVIVDTVLLTSLSQFLTPYRKLNAIKMNNNSETNVD